MVIKILIAKQTTEPNWLNFFEEPIGTPGGAQAENRFFLYVFKPWARLVIQ